MHAGLGGGFVLSCVWLLALRLAAGLMVWLSILGANLLLLACAGFCYAKSGLLGSAGSVGAVRRTAKLVLVLFHLAIPQAV